MGIDADMFNSPEWMSEALRIGNTAFGPLRSTRKTESTG